MSTSTEASAVQAPPRLHFRLPPDPARLHRARERIRDYLHSLGVSERSSPEIVTAIEEAMTNAVRHSGSPDLEVVLRFEGADLIAEVRDHGHGFAIETFDPTLVPDPMAPGGRGLFLIARLMDDLSLHRDDGLEVRMRKLAVPLAERSPAIELGVPGAGRLRPTADRFEARERSFLEQTPEGFAALDWEYRFTYANSAALALYGCASEELIGKTVWELFSYLEGNPLGRALHEAMELGLPEILEYESPHLGRFLEYRVYPTRTGVSYYARDIDERKRIERERDEFLERLQTSQMVLERSQELAHLGSWELDLITNELFWSDEVYRIFGLEPQEFDATYEAFLDHVHADDRQAVDAAYSGSLRDNRDSYEIEHRIVRTDNGEIRRVLERCEHIRDEAGQIVRSIGMVHDITERKQARETLRQSHERFATVFQKSPFALALSKMPEATVVEVNPAFERLFGFSRDELLGRTSPDLGISDHESHIQVAAQLAKHGGCHDFECVRRTKSGEELTLSLNVDKLLIGGEEYVLTSVQDVTTRKRAEADLRASEQRFRLALRNAPVSVAVQDQELRYVWAYNQRTAELEQIIGKRDSEIFTPGEVEHITAVKRRVLDQDVEVREQMWFERPSGRIFLDVTWSPIHDETGNVVGVGSATVDLTPMKCTQEALAASEENARFLADVIQKAAVPFGASAPDGRLILFNEAFAELTGYSRSELEQITPTWSNDLTPVEWREAEADRLATAVATRQPVRYEKEYLRKDGTRVPIELFVQPIFDESGALLHYRSFLTDITERKKSEQTLRESEERFRFALQNAPVSVSAQDRDLRFIWAYNQRSAGQEEIIGKLDADIFMPAEAEQLVEIKRRVLNENVEIQRSMWLQRPSGPMYLEVSFEPLHDESGRVVGVGTATVDLTDMKLAEEAARDSESRFRSLFESMTEGVALHELIYDDGRAVDYRILDVNPAFESQTGITAQQARGRRASELYGTGEAPYLIEYARVAETGESFTFETCFAPMERHFQITVISPEQGRFATVFADVTEHKQAGDAVARTHRRSELLADTAAALLASADPQGEVEHLCSAVMAELDCQVFFNFLVDEPAGRLHLNAWAGIAEEEARHIEWLDFGSAVSGCVACDAVRSIAEDVPAHSDPLTDLVASFGVRAYAAHPLIAEGRVLGTLSFGTRTRTHFCDEDLELMEAVADQVAIAIDRQNAAHEVARLYEEQLRIATTLQQNLRHPLPNLPGLELGLVEAPAYAPELIGGDFWDVFELSDGRVMAVIGDVAGKGISAAGATETVRSMMRSFASIDPVPAFVLRKTSQLFMAEGRDTFVTALVLIIDPKTGRATLSSAGHPGPLHLQADACRIVDPVYGPPLGAFESEYASMTLQLGKGESLILYTDGVTEARREGELFGEKRLLKTACGSRSTTVQEMAESIREAASNYASRLMDDLQVLVIRRGPAVADALPTRRGGTSQY